MFGKGVSTRRWIVSRGSLLKSFVLATALLGLSGLSASAQDWTDYMHWPYNPPQNPGSGHEYKSLYDGWYLYPKEQRIVPQIQGPFYRNYYGGTRKFGIQKYAESLHPWTKRKFYQGNHYILDVF
jgi:hypothetical protein